MKYCEKCLQVSTRPGLLFDENGVCYGCKWQEEKENIDWQERKRELLGICESAKRKSNGKFDCVIGVSGGKDSTFQALYAKNELGLNALLVNNVPDPITEIGRFNLENLVQHGFDLVSIRTNPNVMKNATKYSFYKYGNIVKPSEYTLYSVSYQTALAFNIPLIIQGENPGLTLGEAGYHKADGDALGIKNHRTLGGGNASDWIGDGIERKDLLFYQFPDVEKINKAQIKAIYLNYYLKEYSYVNNMEFAIAHGLRGREEKDLYEAGRYRRYDVLDSNFQVLNQMIKYYKFGFGFATDEASYEIREGKITREKGIELVKKYDGKIGEKYIEEFCKFIDITKEEFWSVVDKYVNRRLFEKDTKTGKWIPQFSVGVDFEG